MKKLITLLMLVSISGCFPATTQELRQEASSRVEFSVTGGYQAVYRLIVPMARKCGGESAGFAEGSTIRADLYTDIRKGEIAKAFTSIFGESYQWTVELEWSADDRTKVIVYQAHGSGLERAIHAWANGNTQCGMISSFPPMDEKK